MFVAAVDPGVAVGGLAEDVEQPAPRGRLPHPGLVVPVELLRRCRTARPPRAAVRDEELEPAKPLGDLGEPLSGHADLEILVLPALPAEEEVDRPAGGDVPRCLHAREQFSHLIGPPCVPEAQVGLERPGVGRILELHRAILAHA